MSVLKLSNPDAHASNLLVLHASKTGCCIDKPAFCKYFIEADGPASGNAVTSMVIETANGPQVFNLGTNTTEKATRIAIAKALREAGYDPYYEDSYRGVIVKSDYYAIIGEAKVISLTIDGVATNFTSFCTTGKVCKFEALLAYETDPGILAADGGTGEQVGTTDGFAAGASASVKSAIEAALDELTVDYFKVEVTEDTVNSRYSIKIHLHDGPALTLGGTALTECGCYVDFVS